jgi:NitT/TauT family transport system ATP-binding protein
VELLRLWEGSGLTIVFITHNVEEAIFLARRVIIIGGEPGHIIEEMEIDLPHPRDPTGKEMVDHLLRIRATLEKLVRHDAGA